MCMRHAAAVKCMCSALPYRTGLKQKVCVAQEACAHHQFVLITCHVAVLLLEWQADTLNSGGQCDKVWILFVSDIVYLAVVAVTYCMIPRLEHALCPGAKTGAHPRRAMLLPAAGMLA